MKRKVLVLVAIVLMVVSFSGCCRFNMAFKVKPNGKVDMTMLVAADEDYMKLYGYNSDSLSEEAIREAKKDGYTAKYYSEDGYAGIEISKKNIKLTELATDLEDFGVDSISELIHVDKKGLTYTFRFDAKDLKKTMMLSLSDDDYARIELKLPIPALESNATSKSWDGRKLTWNIDEMEDDEIYVRFGVISIWKTMAIIDTIICIIAGSFLAIYLTMRKKELARNANMYKPMN